MLGGRIDEGAFVLDGDLLWSAVATAVGAKRLAKMSRISRDGFRSPVVTMLLGEHSWVTHVDNGIRCFFIPWMHTKFYKY